MVKSNINIATILFGIVLMYTLLGVYYTLNLPEGSGDESLFITDINLVKDGGWINAIKKNISIPHMLLVYPLSLFLKNYVVLRLVNLMLLIGLYLYFYLRNKPSLFFFSYFTFYVGTVKVFFIGTNDALFIVGLVIFMNEVFRLIQYNYWKGGLALSALMVSIFTRELIQVYIPIVIFACFLIYKYKGFNKKVFVFPAFLLLLFLYFNISSLKEKNRLSYDLKSPPSDVKVTWVQRQYLAQLMVNEGTLSNRQHPSFQQTQVYINTYGEGALPRTTIEGMLFNPTLTFKEFFKDFYSVCFYGFRQLGLILFITLFYMLYKTRKKSLTISQAFLPLSLLAMMCAFALIIISFVELRWLTPVFIGAILYYSYLESEKVIAKNIFYLNYIALILLSLYGVIRILPKIY